MSALVVAGLVATGSVAHEPASGKPHTTSEALLAAAAENPSVADRASADPNSTSSSTVGLLPVAPDTFRKLRAMDPSADGGLAPFAGTVPLREIRLPDTGGVLGIPEIVLAAYRNAELALESSVPGCGLRWNLLAGIGRIESAHAAGGRTDAAGTTVSPIFGPALDGTLPGNEVIRASDGAYVRAIGPMQFLPSTWSMYSTDGNGDGVADPQNVFDAALAAGKYLCSGGLNLADAQQELRAVLRYNNSRAYAADVLSWSAAYRTGGAPRQVPIAPDLVPPGSAPILAAPPPDMTAVDTEVPTTTPAPRDPLLPPGTRVTPGTTSGQTMLYLPGLPPIPCGIFCPPPAPVDPCAQVAVPAPMPDPVVPARPLIPGRQFGAEQPAPAEPAAEQPNPACQAQQEQAAPQPAAPQQDAPQQATPQQDAPAEPQAPAEPAPAPELAKTPEPQPAPAEPTPPPAPAITLPFGITIPLPPAPVPVPPQG